MEADAKKLGKLPGHVGLVVVEKEFSPRDLANVIVWSATMGISHISVYDLNGAVKQMTQDLCEALERSKDGMIGGEKDPHELQIFTHNPPFTEKFAVGHGMKKAEVHVLSDEDGCRFITQVARSLSRQVLARGISASDISSAFISDTIYEIYSFPNPDLVLTFGSPPSLMGYIPWQTRQVEIICLPTHKDLCYQHFFSSLQIYQGTYQGSYTLPVLNKTDAPRISYKHHKH